MNAKKTLLLTLPLFGLAAAPVSAALSASATTDLNLRSGPGPQYAVESVIPSTAEVDVQGCLQDAEWCEVSYQGTSGWAYSAYLTTPVEDEPVVLYENRERVEVNTVTYDDTSNAAAGAGVGGAWGAAVGSLIVGGPAAVAAGAVLGAVAGAANNVEEKTVTYVETNPVEPVYLDGEVAVGAGIPQEIEVYEVPESDYAYLNVNRQQVLIDPETRRIVKIVR
ncbi:DUF1236 domain-containing protein [Salipiger mangrovisoli]|uniref:DUF1236 domain-containing protein n=1 Tax=Salipiger mangrovisoli TaxID=2865933 RepID=A0ABR9X3L6_9RHOB|nr:DUF1236 domain-containing protein [Salipiger mangrovisoli]MBE9638164.1 DUF1236 domain-containing protein [Salipiger mangrovisoli]